MLQKAEDTNKEQFLEDVKALNFRFPVARIVEETGFNKSSVSKYLSGSAIPSKNFLKVFYEKFPNSRNKVPRGNFLNDTETPDYIKRTKELNPERALIDLLLLEIAKLKSKIYGTSIEDAIDELEKNARIALRQIEKGGT